LTKKCTNVLQTTLFYITIYIKSGGHKFEKEFVNNTFASMSLNVNFCFIESAHKLQFFGGGENKCGEQTTPFLLLLAAVNHKVSTYVFWQSKL